MMMRPAHVPKIGLPALLNFSSAGTKSHASMSLSKVVDSPPGMMSPSTSSSSTGLRTSTASTPHFSSARAWSAKSPWRASTPIRIVSARPDLIIDSPRLQLRLALPPPGLEQILLRQLRGLDPDHGVAEILAHPREHVRILEVRRRLHDRARSLGGIARLENSGSDEDRFRAELHHERRVGGCRDAARGEVRHRQLAGLRDPAHEVVRRAERLRLGHQLFGAQRGQAPHAGDDGAHVADGLDDVAGAGLALGADHRRALTDPPEGLAEIATAAHEGNAERELVDVEVLVGGCQHLGLVDVVDRERFEDLRLHEMADAGLRHHRDRHRLLDLLDLLHRGHPRDPAVPADVGGHALERHDGRGAGVLGDLRLLGVGDVHDDPALEHLGEADVLAVSDSQSVQIRHVISPCLAIRVCYTTGTAPRSTRSRPRSRPRAALMVSARRRIPSSMRLAATDENESRSVRWPPPSTKKGAPGAKATPRSIACGNSGPASMPAGRVTSNENPP